MDDFRLRRLRVWVLLGAHRLVASYGLGLVFREGLKAFSPGMVIATVLQQGVGMGGKVFHGMGLS